LDLLKIPDLMYKLKDSVLYLPLDLQQYSSPFFHFFPRSSWNFVQTIVGFDEEFHVDLSALPMIATNDVGGTSTKNLLHWIQMIRTKRFRPFDYGRAVNFQVYGEAEPPDYDVQGFRARLDGVRFLLFVGQKDSLLNEEDQHLLKAVLPEHAQFVYIPDYNHVDYMWAKDANIFVNRYILEFLDEIDA